MNNEDSVAILMATYNGGKYLRKQLDSILSQTYSNFLLVIRDDGSNDDTNDILDEYKEKDNRVLVYKNESKVHGAFVNFWQLLYLAKKEILADYYFLSDQDDIWAPDKILNSIDKMKNDKDIPVLLYSDMKVIDDEDVIIYKSYNEKMHINIAKPQATFYTRDIFWGCTMAFNYQLLSQIPLINIDDSRNEIMSHDTYLAEFAALFGKVVYLNQVTLNHRKHSNNVTGKSTLKYDLKTVINKIFENGINEKSKKHARTYAQSLIALREFRENGLVSPEGKAIEDSIINGGIVGCNALRKYRIRKANISRTVLTYYIMLFKLYKKHLPYWLNYRYKRNAME